MTSPALRRGAASCQRGSVTQFDRDAPELQPPAAARSEIDLADGVLGGQAQPVGRGAATGNDGLAPELGERFERLADARRTRTEPGLDGMHVDALADTHQPPGAGEARQRLVHRRALAQVKEGGRTDRRRLGQARGMLHDALREAGHGPVPQICQKYRRQSAISQRRFEVGFSEVNTVTEGCPSTGPAGVPAADRLWIPTLSNCPPTRSQQSDPAAIHVIDVRPFFSTSVSSFSEAQRAVVWAWRGPVTSVPFPAGMDISQAGIFFPETGMVANRSGRVSLNRTRQTGIRSGTRSVARPFGGSDEMTRTRDRRVSQRAVDGQRRASTSNRVPLSSAARHLGLSAAVSAPLAVPGAVRAAGRSTLLPGGGRGTARLRGGTLRKRVATGAGDATVFERALARLGQTHIRVSAQSKFAPPALDDDALYPGLRDQLLLLRSDDPEDQSMLVVVPAGGGDGSHEGGAQLLRHDEAPVSVPHRGKDRTTLL